MAGTNGDNRDRRKNRGRRTPPVIELTATEVPQEPERAAEAAVHGVAPDAAAPHEAAVAPEMTAAPVVEPQADSAKAADPPPQPEPEGDRNEARSPDPEFIAPPSPPPAKPAYALPMAAAGLIGAIFGAFGGAIIPGLLGGAPAIDTARIQKIEQSVAEIGRRPAPVPSNPAELQALAQRLSAMETEVGRRLATQDQKIAAAQTSAAPAAPVDLAPLTARLDSLDRALSAVDQKAEASRAAAADSARSVEPQLRQLSAGLAAADQKADAARAAVTDGLRAIEPQLQQLATRTTQTAQRMEVTAAAPLFSAVQTLQQALQRGVPFTSELTALEALGARPEQVAALKAVADKGAPSAQQLLAAFQPLAVQAARAAQPPATGMQAVIDSVVRTRAVGSGAADTPDGLISAIETALRAGDASAALAAWGRLPEPSRKTTEAWAALARQRAAAEKNLRDLQDSAVAALRKAAP